MSAEADVRRQKTIDHNWDSGQSVLDARIAAVRSAQEAVAAGEQGASYALRQSLVDLAAIAELIAGEMPAPRA